VDHYFSYRTSIRRRFGKPVLTIPVNGGFSCPNRDGTKSRTGCVFCDNRSFSPAADNTFPVLSQIERAVEKASRKFDAFIVYLQPFSNTYGSIERLVSLYEPIAAFPKVVGLAIGTRPDCFSDELFEYLRDLSTRTYLSVEIGLQSAHDETLALNNRGHTMEDFRRCVVSLSSRRIETVAHVMLGLVPETPAMMNATAIELARLPVTGIKIHQLMVIKGTELEQWYRQGRVRCMTLEEYAAALDGFLSHVRPDQSIHRIVADCSERNGLISPLWSADKMKALRYIRAWMDKHATVQGSKWKEEAKKEEGPKG
jgi:radical SAM protein (TIGR01212 family)